MNGQLHQLNGYPRSANDNEGADAMRVLDYQVRIVFMLVPCLDDFRLYEKKLTHSSLLLLFATTVNFDLASLRVDATVVVCVCRVTSPCCILPVAALPCAGTALVPPVP